jgi:hypothetical protein
LHQHAFLHAKVTASNDPDLQPSKIIIGNLPPVDMLLNHHCSAFPIPTLPTQEQLSDTDQLYNPATILAVNFAVCKEITPEDLDQIKIPIHNSNYAIIKSHFEPIPTNTYNYSIDFLPDHEYRLFRVTKTVNATDPQCVLPQSPKPTKVLIYQGTPSENPSYSAGSKTEFPVPKPEAHTFPITYSPNGAPIIYNKHNGTIEPYTSVTVQSLFKTQACIPINRNYDENPWMCPNNPSQLWRQPNPVFHVVDDPKTVPLSLAIRLIQVITTKRGASDVYRSWALPHLENALTSPINEITYNRFSYSWQQQNHPEYQYLNQTPPTVLNFIPGESSLGDTSSNIINPDIACNLPNPSCPRHNDVNETLKDSICNVIRYQLDTQPPLQQHTVFLAVQTRNSTQQAETPPEIEPESPIPDNSDNSSESAESLPETPNVPETPPISNAPNLQIDTLRTTPTSTT